MKDLQFFSRSETQQLNIVRETDLVSTDVSFTCRTINPQKHWVTESGDGADALISAETSGEQVWSSTYK